MSMCAITLHFQYSREVEGKKHLKTFQSLVTGNVDINTSMEICDFFLSLFPKEFVDDAICRYYHYQTDL